MVGDRTVGRFGDVKQGSLDRIQTVFMLSGARSAKKPKSRSEPDHRASVVVKKRGNSHGAKGRRKVEVRRPERRKRKPTRVPARASRWWNQSSAIGLGDSERVTDGLGDHAKSYSLSKEHPLSGEPDAGKPPVRFGGG